MVKKCKCNKAAVRSDDDVTEVVLKLRGDWPKKKIREFKGVVNELVLLCISSLFRVSSLEVLP